MPKSSAMRTSLRWLIHLVAQDKEKGRVTPALEGGMRR